MNLNNILLVFCLLLANYSFSQKRKSKLKPIVEYPALKVIKKDTVIIFTIEQARELSNQNEQRKKLLSEVKVLDSKMKYKDSVILLQEKQIFDLKMVKFDYDELFKQMQRQQQVCSDEKAIIDTEIKKQRRHKNLSIISGVLSFGTMLYFYIINN